MVGEIVEFSPAGAPALADDPALGTGATAGAPAASAAPPSWTVGT